MKKTLIVILSIFLFFVCQGCSVYNKYYITGSDIVALKSEYYNPDRLDNAYYKLDNGKTVKIPPLSNTITLCSKTKDNKCRNERSVEVLEIIYTENGLTQSFYSLGKFIRWIRKSESQGKSSKITIIESNLENVALAPGLGCLGGLLFSIYLTDKLPNRYFEQHEDATVIGLLSLPVVCTAIVGYLARSREREVRIGYIPDEYLIHK